MRSCRCRPAHMASAKCKVGAWLWLGLSREHSTLTPPPSAGAGIGCSQNAAFAHGALAPHRRAPLPTRSFFCHTSQSRVPFATHPCSLPRLCHMRRLHPHPTSFVATQDCSLEMQKQNAERSSVYRVVIRYDTTPQKDAGFFGTDGCNQVMHLMPFPVSKLSR
jgi:hypothetical protein